VDTFEGRLLNPGHSIEAMWFLMDLSQRFEGSEATVIKAKDILLRTL
jgi:N-acylglucosamine 2-epimerase